MRGARPVRCAFPCFRGAINALIDRVIIGSCTNGRIEDLREVAKLAKGKKAASNVNATVVRASAR